MEPTDLLRTFLITIFNKTFNLKTIGVATGKAIQKARAAKGLSQKELAQLVNEKVAIIVECESGKLANASQQVINKLERILEVSLRGKNMGNPIAKKPPPTKTTSGTSGKSPAKK